MSADRVDAATYAAANGVDGPGCGAKASPCRSITAAVAAAADGDTIIVGPGRYGDLNSDGVLDDPGDEQGFPFCGCMLGIERPVTIVSSDGAGATIIDGHSVTADTATVFLIGAGIEFGKPGKGFTVTDSRAASADGLVIVGEDISVRGNQLVARNQMSAGIMVGDTSPGPVLVEANQAIGWANGILAQGTGTTIRKNEVSLNGDGIFAVGSGVAVLGNVASGNSSGVATRDGALVAGNALIGNGAGVYVSLGLPARVEKNNFLGNFCGINHQASGDVDARNNYWGAATGPGDDPADPAGTGLLCHRTSATVTSSPFATKPFSVKARVKP